MYSTPWVSGWWHLKDAVDYMVGGSMSVLDLSAKNRETLLYNRYQAARDNIHRTEPPFAYVISDRQADVPEAGLLAQKMIDNGLDVYQTKPGFKANGIEYPAGSWVIPMDQPFSPMAKELMERQVYPIAATGETAVGAHLPYDITGWTLPLQMGVSADTVLDPMDQSQRSLMTKIDHVKLPESQVAGNGSLYVVSHKPNAAFQLVNAALAQGGSVALAQDPVKTAEGMEKGAFVISGVGHSTMTELASKFSVGAVVTPSAPTHEIPIKKARIGLYRPWNASIDEGWTRWILENYNYDAKSLYNADIRSAGLRSRYDIIIIPDMNSNQLMNGFRVGSVPGQYAGGIEQDGLNNLREFVQLGGTLIAFNQSASSLIPLLSLPVRNVLQGLGNDKFYCAGSLLRVEMQHPDVPINFGVPMSPVVMFERGPAFEMLPGFKGIVLARYAKETDPLESGMVMHSEILHDKIAALQLSYGRGRILLYGFKPQQRGQAHGTYRYLFNALYLYEDPPLQSDAPTPAAATTAPQPTTAATGTGTPAAQEPAAARRRSGGT